MYKPIENPNKTVPISKFIFRYLLLFSSNEKNILFNLNIIFIENEGNLNFIVKYSSNLQFRLLS